MFGIRRESYDAASAAGSTTMTMFSNHRGQEKRETIKQIIPDLNLKKMSKRISSVNRRPQKTEDSSSENTNNTNRNIEIDAWKQKAPLNTTRNEIPIVSGKEAKQ